MKMNQDYFKDEYRDGYLVAASQKQLWAVLLDLVHQFDVFCKTFGLKYFALGGTMLGAARHKGFIPWDDDIDLGMFWDDYKVLLEKGPDYFKGAYFLQNYQTEKECEPQLAKLRRTDTTGGTKWEIECISPAFNKGIFIDIFPLFNIPDSVEEKNNQVEEIMHYWKLYKGYEVDREKQFNEGHSPFSPQYDEYEKMFLTEPPYYSYEEVKQKYVDACSKYMERTTFVGPISFRSNSPKTTWRSEWFDEIIYLPFENMMMPCMKQYDEMLTVQYGNWREPDGSSSIHELGRVDVNRSYCEIFPQKKTDCIFVRHYTMKDYDGINKIMVEVCGNEMTKDELSEKHMDKNKMMLVATFKDEIVGYAFLTIDNQNKSATTDDIVVQTGALQQQIKSSLLMQINKIVNYLS